MNKVQLIGNLGRDPEFGQTHSGVRVCNFPLATSDRWTDKQTGEKRERTEWHRVVVFNERLVEVIEKYVKKGSKLYVEGALQTRKFQDQSGQDRYMTEVVLQAYRGEIELLDTRSGNNTADRYDDTGRPLDDRTQTREPGGNNQAPVEGQDTQSTATGSGGDQDLDDEIPF